MWGRSVDLGLVATVGHGRPGGGTLAVVAVGTLATLGVGGRRRGGRAVVDFGKLTRGDL